MQKVLRTESDITVVCLKLLFSSFTFIYFRHFHRFALSVLFLFVIKLAGSHPLLCNSHSISHRHKSSGASCSGADASLLLTWLTLFNRHRDGNTEFKLWRPRKKSEKRWREMMLLSHIHIKIVYMNGRNVGWVAKIRKKKSSNKRKGWTEIQQL